MPEIGEVARLVHFLKKHLVGKVIKSVQVQDDPIVYGKAGTTAEEFKKAMTGKKVVDAQQQGKYFWLVMSSPPHPVLHNSMTGWIHLSNEFTGYRVDKAESSKDESWPPRFWKFILETDDPKVKAAFIDARRLGRVRLVDCAADALRKTTPLKENGPDPVIDKDVFTKDWFFSKVKGKRVPIKAFLLDQSHISGIGNWVGDEILYNARVHPEQYTNSLSDAQLSQLYDSILEICTTAVETLADVSKFPEDWLMKYRWGKGKKGNVLPNGEKIEFLTVGGRTSAVVPTRQKKTGPVAADVEGGGKAGKGKKANGVKKEEDDEEEVEEKVRVPKKRKSNVSVKEEEADESKPKKAKKADTPVKAKSNGTETPRRRYTRVSSGK